MKASRWTTADLPELTGQTWLVTGATRGLGLATARAASARGARIILGVRDVDRGSEIAKSLGNAEVIRVDLASLSSVHEAAEQVPSIDVLINNAGASTSTRRETIDGFEWHLGVNFLGPFLLTNLLAERIARRVVIVTSIMHRTTHFDFDDPHFRRRPWRQVTAYSQSKLAGILWAHALQRTALFDVQTSHPGWSNTALANPARTRIGAALVEPIARRLANPAEIGALTTLYAATQDLPPVSLVGPMGLGQLRGSPVVVESSRAARNPELASRLWEWASRETGSDIEFPAP